MTRDWPIPRPGNSFHCMTDGHIDRAGGVRRRTIYLNDIRRDSFPEVAFHLHNGDLTDGVATGNSEDTTALAFMQQVVAARTNAGDDAEWLVTIGNHDMIQNVTGTRTAEEAATAFGFPNPHFVKDLDYAVIIGLSPTFVGASHINMTFDTAWLDAQLTANAGRTCLIAAHTPLDETVGVLGYNSYKSTDAGFHAVNDAELRAVLADHPNEAKAWLSGHTHSPVHTPDIVKREQVLPGAHYIAHVNSSSMAYTSKDTERWTDGICDPIVTVYDDLIEVRFRDHLRHQWIGSGSDRVKTWKIAV